MTTVPGEDSRAQDPVERNSTTDYLATFLLAQGVRKVFGVPGEEANFLIDALHRHGIEFIRVNHEVTAGYAAEAAGYITGVPGVCISTLGPGAANLVSGVSLALLERSPVLGLSGDTDTSGPLGWTKQRLPLEAMFKPIVRYAATVSADTVTQQLPEAFAATLAYPAAPSYLAFPVAEQTRPLSGTAVTSISLQPNPRDEVSLSQEADELIIRSRRPVLLAGLGVALEGQGEVVQRLAEQYQVPIVLTPKVKGHIPENHALLAGVLGPYGDKPVQRLLGEADLIIALGLDGVDFNKRWPVQTPLVSVAPVIPGDPSFPAVTEVAGTLRRLIPEIAALHWSQIAWPRHIAQDTRKQALQALASKNAQDLDLPAVLEEMQPLVPRNSVVTCDSGAHKQIVMGAWPAYEAKTFLISNGLAAMGYAVPAALASKLLRPERPTISLVGDGCLTMYAGELETLARLRLPVIIIVLNDHSYSLIRLKQLRGGLKPIGVDFASTNLAAMASALGVHSWSVADRKSFRSAMEQALGLDEPALIEVNFPWQSYQAYQ